MKKKFEKQYEKVQEIAANLIIENAENPDIALAKLKLLPRSQRRLIQRVVRKKNKGEENAATN